MKAGVFKINDDTPLEFTSKPKGIKVVDKNTLNCFTTSKKQRESGTKLFLNKARKE